LVKDILARYAQGTGQLLNSEKCSAFFGDACTEEAKEVVRGILQVQADHFEDKYLGLPVPEGRTHRGRLQSLLERLCKRMVDWGDKLMSTAAKEILIKAIAQAIPTYIMGVFKLPMSVCDDLTKLIRSYWWGVEDGRHKTHWVAWEK
jgi:hypothetical protein